MKKPIMVVTHERSGTHLLINLVNYSKNGDFSAIGKLPDNVPHDVEHYKDYVYKHVLTNRYDFDLVSKSHHQVEFFEDYMDYLLENYSIIYLKREIKDVLLSYYRFLNSDTEHHPIVGFPELKDWIFMNPKDIGYKFFANYPDPHVVIEPSDYIDRVQLHVNGWMKYKDRVLVLDYEDILKRFEHTKYRIEKYLNQKIGNTIPRIDDKNLPNFYPNKGLVGSHKEIMDSDLIKKIDERIRR